VELYVETRSFKEMHTAFAEKYMNSPVPSKRTVRNLMKRWRETGSVADKRVGQQPIWTLQLVATIQKSITSSPKKSTRHLSQQVGASRSARFTHKATPYFGGSRITPWGRTSTCSLL
jgi:hypothetical protein